MQLGRKKRKSARTERTLTHLFGASCVEGDEARSEAQVEEAASRAVDGEEKGIRIHDFEN